MSVAATEDEDNASGDNTINMNTSMTSSQINAVNVNLSHGSCAADKVIVSHNTSHDVNCKSDEQEETHANVAPNLLVSNCLAECGAQSQKVNVVGVGVDEGCVTKGSCQDTFSAFNQSKKDNQLSSTNAFDDFSAFNSCQLTLSDDDLLKLPKDEILDRWTKQNNYVLHLKQIIDKQQKEISELKCIKESEERLKVQLLEAQKKEQYHIMRLATKEHELQDFAAQIEELKSIAGNCSNTKNSLLDPAVNLLFERLKRDLDCTKSKMEETQNELAAWKFTPDSNTGKQLMAKCRLLIKENEELGAVISTGNHAKLTGDLALQRKFSEELKKSQSELDEFMSDMDEDLEGLEAAILELHAQLRQAKEHIAQLTAQITLLQGEPPPPHNTSPNSNIFGDASLPLPPKAALVQEARRQMLEAPSADFTVKTQKKEEEEVVEAVGGVGGEGEGEDNTCLLPLGPSLTNGRKRTQSESWGGDDGDGEGSEGEGGNSETEENLSLVCKRTRTQQSEPSGGEKVQVLENGIAIE